MDQRKILTVTLPLLLLCIFYLPAPTNPAGGKIGGIVASVLVPSAHAQGIDFSGFNLVSVEDEINMGKELAPEVEREHPLYRDNQVQRYIRDLCSKLAKSAQNKAGIPLSAKVVKDDEVNAFTIPGGNIYVNSGLIRRLDSEAELAGVIAHEMGHAVNRDGTKQLTRMYGMSFLLSLVLGQDAPQWQQIVGDLFSTAGLLAYGRGAEYEADKAAVRISRAAGYDPNEYLKFLNKLRAMEESQPNLLTDLFSTHPDTNSRIGIVQGEIAAMAPATKKLIVNTTSFKNIRKRVR